MRKYLLLTVMGVLIVVSLSSCSANRAVTVDEGFWDDKGAAVGIVLCSLPEPEVTVKIGSTTVSRKERTYMMSRRYQQNLDHEPAIRRDQRELWHYLNTHEVKDWWASADVFAQRLEARGYRVVRIEEQIDLKQVPEYVPGTSGYAVKDYRKIPGVQDLDLLMVLNVQRYGAYCYYLDTYNIYTDVNVELSGEMVDLGTNRLLWRSPFRPGRVKRASSCRCAAPGSYHLMADELGSALGRAVLGVADDFFSGASR